MRSVAEQDELRRLSPDASVGSQRINEVYRYVERVMVVVDKWDEDFELVGEKVRSETSDKREKMSKMLKFQKLVYSALAQVKRLALLKSISVQARCDIEDLHLFYQRERTQRIEDLHLFSTHRSTRMNAGN